MEPFRGIPYNDRELTNKDWQIIVRCVNFYNQFMTDPSKTTKEQCLDVKDARRIYRKIVNFDGNLRKPVFGKVLLRGD